MKSLKITNLLYFILLLSCNWINKQVVNNSMHSNKAIDSLLRSNSNTVILTYSKDCPFCIRYTETIRKINKELPKNFQLYLLKVLEDEEWDFQDQYLTTSNLLNNNKDVIISSYNLSVYPEVLILDSVGNMLYKGKIDNRAHETGIVKSVVTKEYLKTAITEISNGTNNYIKRTQSVGCFIETEN